MSTAASAVGMALHKESGLVAHLGHRGERPVVPDGRRDEVGARPEHGRDVEGLIAPVVEVALGGSLAHADAVDEEHEPVVRGHVDDEDPGRGLGRTIRLRKW